MPMHNHKKFKVQFMSAATEVFRLLKSYALVGAIGFSLGFIVTKGDIYAAAAAATGSMGLSMFINGIRKRRNSPPRDPS